MKYHLNRAPERIADGSFSGLRALLACLLLTSAAQAAVDYGDYSPFGSASSTVLNTLKIGPLVDGDASNTTNATATGDDTTGSDDEDGVTVPATITKGATGNTLTVNVTNTTGSTVFLNIWIDFNRNGVLTDSGEQITNNTTVANGTSNSNRTFNFTVPNNASPGTTGVRVRLTSTSSPGPIGVSGNGEVEDHVTTTGGTVLWLIDEDHTISAAMHLWSFDNYTNPAATSHDYGRLKYRRPSDPTVRDIEDAGDIESMAVNRFTGEAYILSTERFSGAPANTQSLWIYNLNDAAANAGNIILTLLGHIQQPTSGGAIECLAYDPGTKRFYTADPRDNNQNNSTTTDRLYYLDIRNLNANPMLASTLTLVGDIAGQSQVDRYTDGLEMTADGRLYAVDGTDDHVYEISPTTGAILAVSDNNIVGGVSGGSVDVETLAWDDVNNRMIAVDNSGLRFIEVTLGSNGSNVFLANFYPGVPGMPSTADLEASAMYDSYPPKPKVGVGNLVFKDANLNGRYDSGEGADGVAVELYDSGDTPGTSIPVAITTTAGGGLYAFTTLTEGSYFIHIPLRNFAAGQALDDYESVPGTATGDDSATGEDGVDAASPSTTGISTAVFTLMADAEPTDTATETGVSKTTDNADDDNTDLTVDLGFRYPPQSIGNMVWTDANVNGVKDAAEVGISGVGLQLFRSGQNPLSATPTATTTTSATGAYVFNNLVPGQYFIYIPTPPASAPLSTSPTVTTDNSVDNDDNGTQTAQGQPVTSPVITLTSNGESIADGDTNSNTDLTLDFGFRTCPAITISPATLA
ncbi:MAG: SdrD B-like domain-containing protein, partial [Prosthecobacter sp.]|uniref:SdrD B-like domain-containing protein n=1 Tax=Prosthecobacter sp. TaxID=1965333 RepID=UPI0038FF290C